MHLPAYLYLIGPPYSSAVSKYLEAASLHSALLQVMYSMIDMTLKGVEMLWHEMIGKPIYTTDIIPLPRSLGTKKDRALQS
jgi:hypothetical protein